MHIRLIFRNRRRIKAKGHFEKVKRAVGCARVVGSEARKALCISEASVPQTDTGRWDEDSKANGRRVVKELGKLTP